MLLLTSTFAYLWMAFHNNRIPWHSLLAFHPFSRYLANTKLHSSISSPRYRWSTDKSLPVVWFKFHVGFSFQWWWPAGSFWSNQCKLPEKLCLTLAELLSLSSKGRFCWHIKGASLLVLRLHTCWVPGLLTVNAHMELNHPCKEDSQWCDEWKLQHPLAERMSHALSSQIVKSNYLLLCENCLFRHAHC